jgi:coenzyme PQQ precursor peptide PqqA
MSTTENRTPRPATTPPPAKRPWARPDFRDFDTPMEVTAYAART